MARYLGYPRLLTMTMLLADVMAAITVKMPPVNMPLTCQQRKIAQNATTPLPGLAPISIMPTLPGDATHVTETIYPATMFRLPAIAAIATIPIPGQLADSIMTTSAVDAATVAIMGKMLQENTANIY